MDCVKQAGHQAEMSVRIFYWFTVFMVQFKATHDSVFMELHAGEQLVSPFIVVHFSFKDTTFCLTK
jgi:hypothetical protein